MQSSRNNPAKTQRTFLQDVKVVLTDPEMLCLLLIAMLLVIAP